MLRRFGIKYVDVIGTSKGKGYAGVMKRHHFGGFPGSHVRSVSTVLRSIASFSSDRGHGGNLKKGKRMAGEWRRARHDQASSTGQYDEENKSAGGKGAVAGPSVPMWKSAVPRPACRNK
jgi:large subunit ribosomal protein L3